MFSTKEELRVEGTRRPRKIQKEGTRMFFDSLNDRGKHVRN
jgi:hypothetical protein